jgi:hypothetical protein
MRWDKLYACVFFYNGMTSSKDSLSFPPLVEKYFIAEKQKETERKSNQSADPADKMTPFFWIS